MVDSMIILHDSTSTDFTNNGLGSLPDAVSCIVVEERNGEYELEMEYPITGKRYSDLSLRKIILAKPNPYSNLQPFRIYAITKPINGIVTVNAEHISYDMSGYTVSPFSASTILSAFETMRSNSVITCPFTFWTDKDVSSTMTVTKPSSMRSLLGGTEGSILDVYGKGEYEFDRYSVKLWTNRGANQGVSIRYGKNLTDLSQEENCSAVFTGVYPFWYSEQDGLLILEEKVVHAQGTYNFDRILPLDLSDRWQEKPTEEQLRAAAVQYITVNEIGVPKVSLTVSFINLSQSEEYKEYALLETVRLCDIVNVEFPELNVSASSKCIRTKYNALTGKYTELSLGNYTANLATTIADQNRNIIETPTKSFLEQTVDYHTKLITGGLGGYAVIHSSTGGGRPDEILVMDTEDIHTAVNVWRWNKNGLGYSSTGYNGPYGTAITSDGQIVADFITAGILSGSLLQADSVSTSAISSAYKAEVTNEIGDAVQIAEQIFVVANQQLQSVIASVEEILTEDINTLSSTVSSLQQTIDALSLSFTQQLTGGTNLVRNSSGQNGISDDWVYTGVATSVADTDTAVNTSAKSAFYINSGTLSQELSVIIGKQYTLTLKARTSQNQAYVKLESVGTENFVFDLQSETNWTEYKLTVTPVANTMKLIAGTSGSMYIADIMIAEGDMPSHWSPAADEIYTTNIKFDRRGLRVTNANSDTETIIDNTQFAVQHRGETVITVNKDETILKKATVNDIMTIGKLRMVPRTDGIDFVLLD